jgi:hypothetical protein
MRTAKILAAIVFFAAVFTVGGNSSLQAYNCTITDGYGTAVISGTCQNGCGDANAQCQAYCNYTAPELLQMGCIDEWYQCVDDPEGNDVDFECHCLCWY